MKNFLEALNRPADAYRRQSRAVAWLFVAATIIIVTVLDPILHQFSNPGYHADLFHIFRTALWGIAGYLLISCILWLICKCFGSKTALSVYINTWGISFFPNIICSFIVAVTEAYLYVFWNSLLWSMVFSIVFVGILIWKIILYIIFLKETAALQGGKLAGAFLVNAVMIAFLTAFNGYIGLKTPII